MLRKYFYPVFLSVFACMVLLIVVFGKKKVPLPSLKERETVITPASEWLNTKAAIEGLLANLRKNPGDIKAKLHLSQAYMQEARTTGDHAYYDKAALQLLEDVLEEEPQNVDALCGKAGIYLSAHRFADALQIALQAKAINPRMAYVYGLLVDAYTELGEYTKAVEMADSMVAIRPDIRSYARVSYLREIHGDYPGAIQVMDMAVKAGLPGLEQTAWVRVNLGQLYEHTGQLLEAEMQYRQTLAERTNYAYALAGLGRVEKAKGNYTSAIQYLEKASQQLKEVAFADELTDLYFLSHQPEKAIASAKLVIHGLQNNTYPEDTRSPIVHYSDLELAYAYLKTKEYDLALKHALVEHKRRPKNIDVNEALAWVYYKKAAYAEANKHVQVALRTNSQNPVLLYRAGIIQIEAGQKEKGLELMQKALSINPFMAADLKAEGQQYLAVK
jgi:tetratricopeptide (TPR) repeat protein